MVPIDCITLHFIYSQLSSRLMIFGWQKQASCGWQLIYSHYYPRYNLAAKSNYLTFFSKINCFDEIIKITDTLHTINKAINARNITEPKSNHSQVTVHLGLIHHLVMHVVTFKSLPSSSVHIDKVFFHTDTLPNYCSCLWLAETYFSLPCMKMLLCWILLHVQHTVFKVMYLISYTMCHITSASLIL